jgi:hypothetical protein
MDAQLPTPLRSADVWGAVHARGASLLVERITCARLGPDVPGLSALEVAVDCD